MYGCYKQDLMPGGVNSPVRAFKSVGGQPIVFDHVKGSHAWDVDGNEYIDYVGTWGPAIIGHCDDEVGYLFYQVLHATVLIQCFTHSCKLRSICKIASFCCIHILTLNCF
jgi:glutamate-1-semialdehyde aminotransferase